MGEEKKEFKVGDLVVVVNNSDNEIYYSKGDVGLCAGGELFDFSEQNNPHVNADGHWFAEHHRLKHYTPIEDLPLWKANHQYLNNEQQQALRKLLHRVQWDEEYAEKIAFSMDRQSILSAFEWSETEHGFEFWDEVDFRIADKMGHEEIQQEGSVVCEEEDEIEATNYTSEYFLQRAIDLQRERGKEYDNGRERSMCKVVDAFNIIAGKQLSESEGWLFMQVLKDVRQWTKPEYHQDSAEDCVSYAALKAEALASGK